MNVYDILEQCLNEIEQGANVDTVLFRYPEQAEELRPILKAAMSARSMSVPAPSTEVVRRNRAKVLQRAAEIHEKKIKSSPSRIWFTSLRRLAVTLAVVVMLFVSGTGLVGASANTLPGDNLYPVKRTWEGMQLFFAFDPQHRAQLEFEQENERLDELTELLAEGRSEKVDFSGYVTRQSGTEWRVSGITVSISSQTTLSQPIAVGDAVRVSGVTHKNGAVLAEQVSKLPADIKLPEGNDNDEEIEQENSTGSDSEPVDDSNSVNENEIPAIEQTKTPKAESERKIESFEGTLESIDSKNGIWIVSGRNLDVHTAEIKGLPVIGATVKVEGYVGADGNFIATQIEILGNSNDNDTLNVNGSDLNSNDSNSNSDDNGNSNGNDNSNDNGNSNDDHGGNSGSGSGGGD